MIISLDDENFSRFKLRNFAQNCATHNCDQSNEILFAEPIINASGDKIRVRMVGHCRHGVRIIDKEQLFIAEDSIR